MRKSVMSNSTINTVQRFLDSSVALVLLALGGVMAGAVALVGA